MEMKQYQTPYEAEKAKNELTKEFRNKYCIMVRKKCIGGACMCFCPGEVIRIRNDKYRAISPICTSPLISGIVDCNINH